MRGIDNPPLSHKTSICHSNGKINHLIADRSSPTTTVSNHNPIPSNDEIILYDISSLFNTARPNKTTYLPNYFPILTLDFLLISGGLSSVQLAISERQGGEMQRQRQEGEREGQRPLGQGEGLQERHIGQRHGVGEELQISAIPDGK